MLPFNKLLYLTLILSTTTTNSQPYMEESYHISTILNIENSEKEKPQPIEIKVGVNENYEELKRKQQAEREENNKKETEEEIILAKEDKKENPKKEEKLKTEQVKEKKAEDQKKTEQPVYEEKTTYEEALPEQITYEEPIYKEVNPVKEEAIYIEPVALNYQRVDANWVHDMVLYHSYPDRYIGDEEDLNAIANLINYTIENYITGNMTTRERLKTLKDVIAQYASYDFTANAAPAENWTNYHSSYTAMGMNLSTHS